MPQRDKQGRFLPGTSGNKKGKNPGTKNKATEAASVLLEGEAEKLTRKAVRMAMKGDTTAMKLCMDRIYPIRKSTVAPVVVSGFDEAKTIMEKAECVLAAVGSGQLAADVGTQLISALGSFGALKELHDFEERLKYLEQKHRN